jgi:aminoglycoside phosphotransferase (APT) family kinase protein
VDEGNDRVEGIEHRAVTEWFVDHASGVRPPLHFDLITGGHSNLTYRVTDSAGARWVLRRPPLGHVLQGAHDMGREYRLYSALADSAVPVPPIVGLCTDPSVNGADFYVTEFVDGYVLRSPADAEVVPVDARPRLSEQLVAGLAAIHAVDLDGTGLADLGKREDYVARQLRTWLRQFNAMTSREVPLVEEVHDALTGRIPPQREATLVHGDYRLDNCLVTATGEVAAVLDWEIATLGDPLADLGYLMTYWGEASDAFLPLGDAATVAEGFASRDDLVATYGAMTGRDTSDRGFYFAFANWRLACILEGVYSRYIGGASPEVPEEVEVFAQSVLDLTERAHELLKEL